MTSSPYDYFISFADADRAWVEGYLLDALEAAGVSVVSEDTFELGTPRLKAFERAVKESRRVLLVISPAYLADEVSGFVNLLAQQYGVDTGTWPVIPILRKEVDNLPTLLAMRVSLRATNEHQANEAIARLLADVDRTPPSIHAPPCPYPGMRTYEPEESKYFFGRSGEIEELRLRLRKESLILIVGPSGSGKSSLVLAGLAPTLAQQGWQIITMRPGEHPQSELDQTLQGVVNPETNERVDGQTGSLLIVVDQLEELFTLCEDTEERRAFIDNLLRLSEQPDIAILLTMRADFFGDLMQTEALWSAVRGHRLEIETLNDANLREAIVKPADAVGVYVEPALVERLVADAAGERGMLPFVQETLVLLWEKLERRFLPLHAYEALILPTKAYEGENGLLVAMGLHADGVYADLTTDKSQALARRDFLRLIQFGEGREDTRRQQSENELRASDDDPELFDSVLTHLINGRLLTASDVDRSGERRLDLAHEALIQGWPTLAAWLEERREAEKIRRRLEAKTEEWQRFSEAGGGLLDELELEEAESWLSSADARELGVSQGLLTLVAHSRASVEANKREKEEAQQRDMGQQRALKQRRWIIAVVSVLFVAAAVAAVVTALNLGDIQENLGDIQEVLTLEQLDEADNKLPQRMLVALESFAATGSKEAEEMLRSGLPLLPIPRYVNQHANEVVDVAFSPDGTWMASAGEDGVVYVRNVDSSNEIVKLEHNGRIWSIDFSPDGQLLASGTQARTVHVWDIETGSELVAPLSQEAPVTWLSFSPDQTRLAVADESGALVIWDYLNGAEEARLPQDGVVYNFEFSPDGSHLVTAGSNGTAKVWNVDGGKATAVLEHGDEVYRAVFSPNGQRIGTASADNTACIWDLTTEERVCVEHDDWVEDIEFGPNGNVFVTASDDNSVRLWEVRTGRELLRMEHDDWVFRLDFHPDGRWMASSGQDGTARVWDTESGLEIARIVHEGIVDPVIFSPDGQFLATASEDNTAVIWEVAFMPTVAGARLDGEVGEVVFGPDSRQLAIASDGTEQATILDISEDKIIIKMPGSGEGAGLDTVIDPSLRFMAEPTRNGATRVWDLNNQREVVTFPSDSDDRSGSGAARPLAFSGDGNLLARGNGAGLLQVWTVAREQEVLDRRLEGGITALAFSPDGEWLASATTDGELALHSLSEQEKTVILASQVPAVVMSFSPDNATLVTAEENGIVRTWNVARADEDGSGFEHPPLVTDLAFSPDGQWLATAGVDQTIRIWKGLTGQEVARIPHNDPVWGVAFSPDGRLLAGSSGGVVMLWDFMKIEKVEPDALYDVVCSRLTRNLAEDEWVRYVGNKAYRETCSGLPSGPVVSQ